MLHGLGNLSLKLRISLNFSAIYTCIIKYLEVAMIPGCFSLNVPFPGEINFPGMVSDHWDDRPTYPRVNQDNLTVCDGKSPCEWENEIYISIQGQFSTATVDRRNPAPVDTVGAKRPTIYVFQPSLWWCRISSTHHMEVSPNRGTPVHHPFEIRFFFYRPTSYWVTPI